MSVIVDIDHETGDLSQYTSTVTDSGDLSAAAGAALAGTSYGLSVLIDDTTAIYGEKTFTASTSGIWRFRLYLDPNSLTMSDLDTFSIFIGYKASSATERAHVLLKRNSGAYTIAVDAMNDAFGFAATGFVIISDAPHYLEFQITRAASSVSSDGRIDWWIDGATQTPVTGIDNYDQFPNLGAVRIGACANIDAGTSGTFFLDELIVNDDGGEIGPASTAYTLVCAQGSYTLTGQAANLTSARTMAAAQGSYTLAGQAAGLTSARKMIAGQGAYVLTGQAAGLTSARRMIAAQGAYILTGQAATLTYTVQTEYGEYDAVLTDSAPYSATLSDSGPYSATPTDSGPYTSTVSDARWRA